MANEEDKTPETAPEVEGPDVSRLEQLRPTKIGGEGRKILCIVMDRTGDTNAELCVPEAVALAREEMGKGKWLRTVNLEGQSNIIRDVREIATDDVAYGIFENVSELEMIAALQGG